MKAFQRQFEAKKSLQYRAYGGCGTHPVVRYRGLSLPIKAIAMAISSSSFLTGPGRKRVILVAAAAATFLAIASRFVVLFPDTEGFYTDEWTWLPPRGIVSVTRLIIRRVAPGSDDFLLTQDERAGLPELSRERRSPLPPKSPGHFAVYRYQSGEDDLQIVSKRLWDEATTEIIDCRSSGRIKAGLHRLDHQIRVRDRILETAGRHVLNLTWSPSGRKVAVLSAVGPKTFTSVMPFFLSNAGYWGQHYHQTLMWEEKTIGTAYRLPFFTAMHSVRSCWFPGEEYLVYYDAQGEWVAILKVDGES